MIRANLTRIAPFGAWTAFSMAMFAFGALLVCPSWSCRTLAFDATVLTLAHDWRTEKSILAFAALTWLGSVFLLLPLSLVPAIRKGFSRQTFFLPFAVMGAAALAQAAKLIVGRPRPDLYPALVDLPADASFPSAHAMQATAFALAWLLRPGARTGFGTAFVAAGLALLVSFSRVHLQVHFPTDVMFGILAGASWALALRSLPYWRTEQRP